MSDGARRASAGAAMEGERCELWGVECWSGALFLFWILMAGWKRMDGGGIPRCEDALFLALSKMRQRGEDL